MKPFFIFACLILFAGFTGRAYGLPQETLLVSDQNSTLLVQCGMDVFDPTQPISVPAQETFSTFSLPAELQQSVTAPDAQVPEPSSLVLIGVGLLLGGLLRLKWRTKRNR